MSNFSRSFLYVTALALFILLMGQGTSYAQNIVSNSGFEIGKSGALPTEWQDQKERGAEGKVVITDSEAYGGKQCLLIELTSANGYIHPNKSIAISPGDYTFSFWAKSDGQTSFLAQIYSEADWSTLFNESCNLDSDKWTKFEFPFSSLTDLPGSIQIGLTSPGKLWLDDVELVRIGEARGTARIQIWDTLSPFVYRQDRSNWKAISAGMELQGDMVLENDYLLVVFPSTSGKVMIHSKSGKKRAEIAPLHLAGKATNITACKILRNTGDEAVVEVNFSTDGRDSSAVFSFSKDQIVQIKPADNMDGVSVFSPIQFAIVPSFISDDLILAPRDYPLETLHIPSENLLLGLLSGADSILAMTWPDGSQKVRINAESEQLFKSVDFENNGESLYLALLDAPGIWYEEVLQRTYLEKDVAIDWKRPFPAKWITQLYEDEVKTTYTFRESKKERYWRAGLGRYTYPVWFDGETAFLRLGKRIPPKEEALIYFLERKGTPVSVSTPVDILKKTLNSETYERIVDSHGRRNRSSNPPSCDYDAATCATTDRLKLVFEAGEETQNKETIKTGTDDMSYFMSIERGRAEEYEAFAHEMLEWLAQMKNDRPELKGFLDEMEVLTREIIAVYEHEKGNIGSVEFSAELAEETQALARQESPDNLEAFMKLKGRWTSMGGAVEDVNRGLHTTTRKMFQRAGYACVTQSEAVEVAQEIRSRIIKCLRRPSPYEIWSDY